MTTDEARVLLTFLDAQRSRALEIISGLTEHQLRAAVLPSGWTALGMIEHLGHAERHWFQEVALGTADPLPWVDNSAHDPEACFTTAQPTDTVLRFYRDAVATSNRIVSETPLSARPIGRHGQGDEAQITDLRFIVLHMIEETARHLGHLDAARELLDGAFGLGQDEL
jgi:uncharacterized damage-inducible protein DinB